VSPVGLHGGAFPRDPAAESLEQLRQDISRALAGESKTLIKTLVGGRNQQLRRRESAGMHVREELPQVKLSPRSADPAGRGTHDGNRLSRQRRSPR
jgi:hypothetical protein